MALLHRVALAVLAASLGACVATDDSDDDEVQPPSIDVPDPSSLPDPDAVLPGLGKADSPGTSCTSTAHVGDSLSAYTLPALRREYTARGVTNLVLAAYGGRGTLQKMPADPETGRAAALRIRAEGFHGCWVVALGTNDTANIAKGTNYTRADAIDRMMRAIDPDATAPVLWVNTFTKKQSGYWANANMRLWNDALTAAKGRWPNLKVFDWAKIAATGTAPYVDDIHHTTAGYTVRNRAITDALATSFPR